MLPASLSASPPVPPSPPKRLTPRSWAEPGSVGGRCIATLTFHSPSLCCGPHLSRRQLDPGRKNRTGGGPGWPARVILGRGADKTGGALERLGAHYPCRLYRPARLPGASSGLPLCRLGARPPCCPWNEAVTRAGAQARAGVDGGGLQSERGSPRGQVRGLIAGEVDTCKDAWSVVSQARHSSKPLFAYVEQWPGSGVGGVGTGRVSGTLTPAPCQARSQAVSAPLRALVWPVTPQACRQTGPWC